MRTLATNIAGAIVGLLVSITTHAAEAALTAQERVSPEPGQTPAQLEVTAARDHLIDSIGTMATSLEHLEAEHAEKQAALQMHSNMAAQAYMHIQGIQGFATAIQSTKAQVEAILNPPSQSAPELIGTTTLPEAPVAEPEHVVALVATEEAK